MLGRRPRSLVLKARAKVNLGLWVGRKRPDGFHDLITVIIPIELHDTIEIMATRSGVSAVADDARVPRGPANLACRAACRFFEETGIAAGCRILIRKQIPVGAGLGGGSSDAAAALVGLNRLHGRPLSRTRLSKLALELGSDVPAMLLGRPCAVRGRGERLRPLKLPCLRLLLYFPGYPIHTAWAYAELDRLRSRRRGPRRSLTEPRLSPKILAARLRQGELEKAAPMVRNSFEPVVFRRYPDLARAKRLMLEGGCCAAALSGSGSTVYGLMEKGLQDPMAALRRQGFSCIGTSSI